MPITTDVLDSNPAQGEVYWIQHYKVCQWLAAGRWFSPGTPVTSTNKTDRHDITEILLKMACNTIKSIQTKRSLERIMYHSHNLKTQQLWHCYILCKYICIILLKSTKNWKFNNTFAFAEQEIGLQLLSHFKFKIVDLLEAQHIYIVWKSYWRIRSNFLICVY